VIDLDGAIVAYAQANAEESTIVESWGVVHPRHRGRGIGTAVLNELERRAAAMVSTAASGRFRHAVDARDRAAAALLEARGLRPVRHFWHMEVDPTEATGSDAATVHGIAIRPVDPATDLPAVHAVLNEAFTDDWDYHPTSFDRWASEHTEGSGYDPASWMLATDGEEPVGAVTASVLDGRGWIDEVGVRPRWRGRGVAAELLRLSLRAFAERGVRRVILNVDAKNPTGATRLYERAGMHIAVRWDLWERPWGGSAYDDAGTAGRERWR
jgi:mycothiol synthase